MTRERSVPTPARATLTCSASSLRAEMETNMTKVQCARQRSSALVLMIIAIVFWLIEAMGSAMQDPFENFVSDTPMLALSRTIEITKARGAVSHPRLVTSPRGRSRKKSQMISDTKKL